MDDPIPDVVEEIRAYRQWAVSTYMTDDGAGIKYLSGFCNTVWPTAKAEPLQAKCLGGTVENPRPDHDSPSVKREGAFEFHVGYGCGIYAFKDPTVLIQRVNPFRAGYVTGEVLLWGRVMPHEWGYRAQYGQIAALWDLNVDSTELARVYGVDLLPSPYSAEDVDAARAQLHYGYAAAWMAALQAQKQASTGGTT